MSTGYRQNQDRHRLADSATAREGRDSRKARREPTGFRPCLTSLACLVSLARHAAETLPDGGKKRPQLHCQTDISADLEPARHSDGWSVQLTPQDPDAIFPCHREDDVRVRMHPFCNLTDSFLNRENVLSAFRPAQIELVNGVETLRSIGIEPARQKLKKLFDRDGIHNSWDGEGL